MTSERGLAARLSTIAERCGVASLILEINQLIPTTATILGGFASDAWLSRIAAILVLGEALILLRHIPGLGSPRRRPPSH